MLQKKKNKVVKKLGFGSIATGLRILQHHINKLVLAKNKSSAPIVNQKKKNTKV
jgi:hypothetical protein